MSPPLSQVTADPRGLAHLLARSAALFAAMTVAVDRLPAELPGLVDALAMRGAVFGAHGAGVAA